MKEQLTVDYKNGIDYDLKFNVVRLRQGGFYLVPLLAHNDREIVGYGDQIEQRIKGSSKVVMLTSDRWQSMAIDRMGEINGKRVYGFAADPCYSLEEIWNSNIYPDQTRGAILGAVTRLHFSNGSADMVFDSEANQTSFIDVFAAFSVGNSSPYSNPFMRFVTTSFAYFPQLHAGITYENKVVVGLNRRVLAEIKKEEMLEIATQRGATLEAAVLFGVVNDVGGEYPKGNSLLLPALQESLYIAHSGISPDLLELFFGKDTQQVVKDLEFELHTQLETMQ